MVSTRSRTRELLAQSTTPAIESTEETPKAIVQPPVKKRRLQPTTAKTGKGRAKGNSQPTKGKRSKPRAGPGSDGANRLHSLPPEILSMVLNNITDVRTVCAMRRTCKDFYARMTPRLYRRIAVAAMFHAHIPKLIRTIEPLLAIDQKKQLKKEGKYKGQQERYPTSCNGKLIPASASYVQQLVVGVADPGKKHKYIVERYIEEVLKNLCNLEALETRVLTEPIAKIITSLKHLQALNIMLSSTDEVDLGPLAKIKNLKHLSLSDTRWSKTDRCKSLQSMIQNSTSTMETMAVHVDHLDPNGHLLVDWEKAGKFTALKSLALSCYSVEAGTIEAMQKAIDFTMLTELHIGQFYEHSAQIYPTLTALANSLSSQGKSLSLRHLFLDMAITDSWTTHVPSEVQMEAKIRFVSSFGTLETLHLENYGEYPQDGSPNPGIHDALLRAILRHRGLRSLKIFCSGVGGGKSIRELSPRTVQEIIDELPRLREFEFVPDVQKMDEICRSLACGTDLSSVIFSTWFLQLNNDTTSSIVSDTIKAFLNYQGRSSDLANSLASAGGDGSSVHGFNLNKVTVSHRKWEIAPKFHGKGIKGTGKAEWIDSDDGTRQAWFRDITAVDPFRIHVGYDPQFEWLNKACG